MIKVDYLLKGQVGRKRGQGAQVGEARNLDGPTSHVNEMGKPPMWKIMMIMLKIKHGRVFA